MTRYVAEALADWESGTALPFATIARQDDQVVGSTRFGNIQFWRRSEESRSLSPHPDAVEIGWTWLADHAQRTGINREAKLLMLTIAFETWGVHRVSFRADSRNEQSRIAIEKLGAKLDGVIRADKIGHDGAIRDTATYSILRSEWDGVKSNLTKLVYRSISHRMTQVRSQTKHSRSH